MIARSGTHAVPAHPSWGAHEVNSEFAVDARQRVARGRQARTPRVLWHGGRHHLAGASLLLALAVALTGCSATPTPPPTATVTPKEHVMAPEQTKAFVQSLYHATTAVAGGTWKVEGDDWGGCAPGHVQYSLAAGRYGYSQPDAEALAGLAQHVQDAWASLGVHGRLATDTSIDPTAYIVSYPEYLIGTDAQQAGYTFQAQSNRLLVTFFGPCVPGDLDKVDPITG